MMLNVFDEVELLGDDVIRISPLKELSHDLLEESIKLQIEDIFSSRTNFLVEFEDGFESEISGYDFDNEDIISESNEIAKDFYLSVLAQIDKRFELELDIDTISALSLSSIKNIAEGMYEFFILKYKKYITKYMTAMLLENCDLIADGIKLDSEDICVYSYKNKLKTENQAILMSHITAAIRTIVEMDTDPSDFISYFNQDKFEVAIVSYAIDNGYIMGEFVRTFLRIVFNDLKDNIYDEIVSDIREKLFKKYRVDKKLSIDDFITEDE